MLTAAVALSVAELAAGITGPQGGPVVAVGGAAIDLTPVPVKGFAIARFGSHDKEVLRPACSAVPKSGAGSFGGMSTAPVATAASANPVLSTLVKAVKQAGLVDTLNSATNITVVAPDNDAFAKTPPATLNKVLANKAMLTKIHRRRRCSGAVTGPGAAVTSPVGSSVGNSVGASVGNSRVAIPGAVGRATVRRCA